MELTLLRTYYPTGGTNGVIMHNEKPLCYTIELPWRNNQNNKSCIPEGKYQLKRFKSSKHGNVLEVMNVPNRTAILIHKANYAEKELKGCIAPVETLEQAGVGWNSAKALKKVMSFVDNALQSGQDVYINIVKA